MILIVEGQPFKKISHTDFKISNKKRSLGVHRLIEQPKSKPIHNIKDFREIIQSNYHNINTEEYKHKTPPPTIKRVPITEQCEILYFKPIVTKSLVIHLKAKRRTYCKSIDSKSHLLKYVNL